MPRPPKGPITTSSRRRRPRHSCGGGEGGIRTEVALEKKLCFMLPLSRGEKGQHLSVTKVFFRPRPPLVSPKKARPFSTTEIFIYVNAPRPKAIAMQGETVSLRSPPHKKTPLIIFPACETMRSDSEEIRMRSID